MFGNKKVSVPTNSMESLIGAGTRIEGNVVFRGGLHIDGEVRGNISCENPQEGTLEISDKASVEGAISVGHVVINGSVIGPIFASQYLELMPQARVTGDLEYHQIEMHQGAVIQGRLVHQAQAASKPVALKLASSG